MAILTIKEKTKRYKNIESLLKQGADISLYMCGPSFGILFEYKRDVFIRRGDTLEKALIALDTHIALKVKVQ